MLGGRGAAACDRVRRHETVAAALLLLGELRPAADNHRGAGEQLVLDRTDDAAATHHHHNYHDHDYYDTKHDQPHHDDNYADNYHHYDSYDDHYADYYDLYDHDYDYYDYYDNDNDFTSDHQSVISDNVTMTRRGAFIEASIAPRTRRMSS